MKISRGCMKDERKKNNIFIIAAVFFIVFSRNIYSSIQSYRYRRLCDQYRKQLIAAEATNRELADRIEECRNITGSIGELSDRNIQSSRDIIEITEELRAKVYELENCLGCFSQSEYYQYWDSYYRNEQLME